MSKKILTLIPLILIIISSSSAQNLEKEKYSLAQSFEHSGDLNNAARIYLELYNQIPANDDYFNAVVRTYLASNRYSELKPIVEQRLRLKQNYQTYSLLGELNWRAGNTAEASKNWDDALYKYSDSLRSYVTVAETQYKLQLIDKAVNTLLTGRKHFNNPVLFSEDLSRLYIATGNYIDGVEEALSNFYFSRDIASAQGKIYALSLNKNAEEYILKRLNDEANHKSNNLLVLELYSFFLRSIKKFNEAFGVTIRIDELKSSEGRDILYFADRSRQDDEIDIALKAYEYIISQGRKNKFFSSALYGYTQTLEKKVFFKQKISTEEAVDIINRYRKIIDEQPKQSEAAESHYRIAVIAFEYLKDASLAIYEINFLEKDFPYLPVTATALNYLGKIYIHQNNFEKAKEVFRTVRKKFSKFENESAIATFYQSEILYFSGLIDSAAAGYKSISQFSETDIANDALERLNLIENNKELTQALTLFAQAELKEFQSKEQDAIHQYKAVTDLARGENLAELSFIKIAKIEFRLANFIEARNTLNTLLEKYPDTNYGDIAYLILGNSFNEESNKEAAIQSYTTILTKYPRSVYLQEARTKIRILRGEKI